MIEVTLLRAGCEYMRKPGVRFGSALPVVVRRFIASTIHLGDSGCAISEPPSMSALLKHFSVIRP
jgi:hypothetical protein